MWGARVEGAGGGRGRRRVLAVFWEEADRRDGRERQYEPRVGGHGGWGSPPLDLLQGRGRAQARAVEAGGPSLRRAAAASTPRATTAFADRAGPLCRARNHLRPARPGAAAAPPAAAMRAEGRREEGAAKLGRRHSEETEEEHIQPRDRPLTMAPPWVGRRRPASACPTRRGR